MSHAQPHAKSVPAGFRRKLQRFLQNLTARHSEFLTCLNISYANLINGIGYQLKPSTLIFSVKKGPIMLFKNFL